MNSSPPILLLILSSFLIISSSTSSSPTSIYDVLTSHGLPIGLIPKGVKEFTFDDDKGRFEVHLENPCDAKFENTVHYERNVSGILSYGQIQALSGLSAQELFLWFPVKGIRVDIPSSGIIYFDVGVIYKRFSLSLFENPPDCTIADHESVVMEINQGKAIAETVAKSLSGKYRYDLDQKFSQIADA